MGNEHYHGRVALDRPDAFQKRLGVGHIERVVVGDNGCCLSELVHDECQRGAGTDCGRAKHEIGD